MREPIFLNRFKKDLKRQKKRGKHPDKLNAIIEYICKFGDAPPKSRPHNLLGEWSGYRECHIEGDWLIIFKASEKEALFYATGTHQDLFKKY